MSTTIQRILVAHDFGDASDAALTYAIDLAEKLGARVTIVHAYEIPVYGFAEGVALTADVGGQIRTLTSDALDRIVHAAARPGLDLHGMLRQGPAWSEITTAATEIHADLVVIGTHGRRGLAHALLGSVAEKVVRTSPCPVLTVHGKAKA
ncbi:MAG TPA: universal stress protein [Polyangiaceae bacterium]|jgi:nucleotide-binding universal stress UspA family protein